MCPAVCFLFLRVHLSWVLYEMGSRSVWPPGPVPLGLTPARPARCAAGVSAPPLPRPAASVLGLHRCFPDDRRRHLRASSLGCCEQSVRERVRTRVVEPACTSSGGRPDLRLLGHVVVLGLTVGGPAKPFSCCERRGFSVLCFVSPGLRPPGPCLLSPSGPPRLQSTKVV